MKSTRLFSELTPSSLAGRLPGLHVGCGVLGGRAEVSAQAAVDMRGLGWSTVAMTNAPTASLRQAVEVLFEARLPLVAIYAFDETWALGAALAEAIGESLGTPYVIVSDFWAFRVGPDESGWAPHRGVSDLLDRDRPELLNVWVALSDASIDQSCMHFVPLDRDDAYRRRDLGDVRSSAAVPAPVVAGTALFWNANILHWGGACAATAPGARVSLSFTLKRADTLRSGSSNFAGMMTAQPWMRIDAIAEQILTYAPTGDEALREWASVQQQFKMDVARR